MSIYSDVSIERMIYTAAVKNNRYTIIHKLFFLFFFIIFVYFFTMVLTTFSGETLQKTIDYTGIRIIPPSYATVPARILEIDTSTVLNWPFFKH